MAGPSVRPAGLDDVDELVRLRALMITSMGMDPAGDEWRSSCARDLRDRLRGEGLWDPALWGGPASVIVVAEVSEAPEGLVASGIGWLTQHLAGPTNPSGLVGHIASMSTDPAWRGQGLARAVFTALVEWFDARGVCRVELNATPMGEGLYRSFGFREPRALALGRTVS